MCNPTTPYKIPLNRQKKNKPGIRDLQKITGFPNFPSTNSYKKKQSSSMFPDATISTA